MNETTAPQSPGVDKLIKAFIMLREKKAELSKEYKDKEEELDGKMNLIKRKLREMMEASGSTQLASDEATAFRKIVRKFNCGDWEIFRGFISEHGRFDMLHKRIGSTAVEEYLEETGELPPGISVHQEYDVEVRRK